MKKAIIIRYAELFLKKKNRNYFETIFENNMKKALDGLTYQLHKNSGRYLVDEFDEMDTEEIIESLKKVFGFNTLSLA